MTELLYSYPALTKPTPPYQILAMLHWDSRNGKINHRGYRDWKVKSHGSMMVVNIIMIIMPRSHIKEWQDKP